jgi:energy-coupling factor transporter ATP-binding protein EcfA2
LQSAEGNKVAHHTETYTVWDPAKTKLLPKSGLAADMGDIFREFFSNMSSDDPEMLAKCFVETKESREADSSLQKIAENLINQITVMPTGTGEQLARQIEKSLEAKRGEFVLIVGNKGAGKSTFIDRFFRLVLSDDLRKQCLFLRVDVSKSSGDKENVFAWLHQTLQDLIETQLFEGGTPTFEQLQGIFWREYNRWREGEFRTLYETDRDQFKIRFGEFLNSLVEENKQRYIDRLLKDIVRSRNLLPCLVFDNTDHFSQTFQEAVFQFAQSLFRATTCFVICPITDRTIWQMSKSGPLQSYSTTQFYLPIPSTKDVLYKRIGFVRDKLKDDEAATGTYFTDRGITLKIPDIEKFALAIEDIFVHTEYVGRVVGWLSNHDIRRGLRISQEIGTSPHLSIETLVTMYVTKSRNVVPDWRIRKALILGDYNSFRQESSNFIVNCFALPAGLNSSPLGVLSVLRTLMDVDSNAASPAGAYMDVDSIINYLEPIGLAREVVVGIIAILLNFRLVEPFDPTDDRLHPDQRVRVTHSGRIHYEFCLEDRTYLEQMAVSTPVTSASFVTNERQRLFGGTETNFESWALLTSNFANYCLDEDRLFASVPATDAYSGQRDLRKRFRKAWVQPRKSAESVATQA